jgi:hypothetical protein
MSGTNLVNKRVGATMSEPTPFVIDLEEEKKKRGILPGDLSYQLKINAMDKTELLEEMVRFNEARARVGQMSLPLMVQGRILFRALELAAYTQELKILAGSYRRQLDHEIEIGKMPFFETASDTLPLLISGYKIGETLEQYHTK